MTFRSFLSHLFEWSVFHIRLSLMNYFTASPAHAIWVSKEKLERPGSFIIIAMLSLPFYYFVFSLASKKKNVEKEEEPTRKYLSK